MHAVNLLRHNLALQAIKTANVIITPQNKFHVGLVGWNNFFDHQKAKQVILEGEKATDKIFSQIKAEIAFFQKNQLLSGNS